jgi:hypothetical protein
MIINEKSISKSQQRLFGMVYAYESGKLDLDKLPKSLAEKIKKIADGERRKTGDKRKFTKGMSKSDVKDFASTKHEDLPETVNECNILKFNDYIFENMYTLDGKDGMLYFCEFECEYHYSNECYFSEEYKSFVTNDFKLK